MSAMRWINAVGQGWASILKPILEQAVKEDAHIAQVKEKFGGLRIYAYDGSDELMNMIDVAENASYKICEYCGEPGVPRAGSWTKTLCDKCWSM